MRPSDPIFVDSAHLIALHEIDDDWSNAAQMAAESLHPRQRLVTSHGILSETLAHFARASASFRFRLADQSRRLAHDPQYTIVAHNLALMDDALEIYGGEFANSSLSLQDCVSILIMREYAIGSILTADQEFARAGFTPLLRRYLDQ